MAGENPRDKGTRGRGRRRREATDVDPETDLEAECVPQLVRGCVAEALVHDLDEPIAPFEV